MDEVALVHATPNYAVVRMPSGRESTVPLRDLAPRPLNEEVSEKNNESNDNLGSDVDYTTKTPNAKIRNIVKSNDSLDPDFEEHPYTPDENNFCDKNEPKKTCEKDYQGVPRRSSRVRKAVDRYGVVPYQ